MWGCKTKKAGVIVADNHVAGVVVPGVVASGVIEAGVVVSGVIVAGCRFWLSRLKP